MKFDVDNGMKWLLAIAITLLIVAVGLLVAVVIYSLCQIGYIGVLAGVALMAIVIFIRRSL